MFSPGNGEMEKENEKGGQKSYLERNFSIVQVHHDDFAEVLGTLTFFLKQRCSNICEIFKIKKSFTYLVWSGLSLG